MAAECPPGNVVAIRMAFWTTPWALIAAKGERYNGQAGGYIEKRRLFFGIFISFFEECSKKEINLFLAKKCDADVFQIINFTLLITF